MRQKTFSWFISNLSTFLLAFLLALLVWVSAVVTADPNVEQTTRALPINVVGKNPDLLLVNEIPTQARLTIKAPRSIWELLSNNASLIKVWLDLSGMEPGIHTLRLNVQIDASPVRLVRADPQEVTVNLESLRSVDFPVEVNVTGNLAPGYRRGVTTIDPVTVVVSGPASLVDQVAAVIATLDVTGATEPVKKLLPLTAVNQDNQAITGVTIAPQFATITQPIRLLGGFRNVAVKVVTNGQVANGYRLTNIIVSPPTVTLYSDDPQAVNEIPGFVETLPVDLNDLSDDIEVTVGLDLPEGITTVREPNVLVQVSVAALESSLTLAVPVETVGLSPELQAIISPKTIDIIVSGPLNVLDTLTASSFRVVLDLTNLPPGVYQRSPMVQESLDDVRVQTTLPETVEVDITLIPTPTPAAGNSLTPTSIIPALITPTPNP